MQELWTALYTGDSAKVQELVAGKQLSFPLACAVGDHARVRELLAQDPSLVHSFSDDGFPAVGLAVFFRQPEIARDLIERGADVNAPARNAQRVAPIHAAASIGDRDMVRLLLDRGADPNARQQLGYVALHTAAAHGDMEMAKALVEHGADPSFAAEDGRTPEDFAREKGHTAFVEWLQRMYQ